MKHSSTLADQEVLNTGGKSIPSSLQKLGDLLSLLYRHACCGWDCKGGDHQIEWLLGRIVNQAQSAHRLMRCAFYDEALMLVRGVGESANLLWLFLRDPSQLEAWKAADRKTRLRKFGPSQVRKSLKQMGAGPVMIEDDRYQALCEIGTHPAPALKPNHFSGDGPPCPWNGLPVHWLCNVSK